MCIRDRDQGAPALVVEFGADAEGAHLIVLPFLHLVGGLADQYVHHVAGAKAAAGAEYAGQGLLGRLGGIAHLGWVQTGVAVAAGGRVFVEIAQQALAPAAGGFAQAEQGVELGGCLLYTSRCV